MSEQTNNLLEEANEKLTKVYQKWYKEIEEKTELTNEGYSNPYYVGIPKDWVTTNSPKILIVGEEGYGAYGAGKGGNISGYDIGKIQELTASSVGR